MLRFVTCFLLVDIYVSGLNEGIKPRSVNLALETILAFDQKDKTSDINFLDDVQAFISKVRKAVDRKTQSRRSLNNADNNRTTEGEDSLREDNVNSETPSGRSIYGLDIKTSSSKSSFDVEHNKHVRNSKTLSGRSIYDIDSQIPARRSVYGVERKTLAKQINKSNRIPLARSFNSAYKFESIKFVDFVKKLVDTLKNYENDDLEDIFGVIDDEIRKYHYKGCKFYELVQNSRIRKFVTDNLKLVRKKRGAEIKTYLNNLQRVLDDAKFNTKQAEILDYINSLYTKNDGQGLIEILNNILIYKNKYKRANTNLVQLVRNGIRTAIFDHYSKLNQNTRRDFKIKIETFWHQSEKAEKDYNRMWNIDYHSTDNPNQKPYTNDLIKSISYISSLSENKRKDKKKIDAKHHNSDSSMDVLDEIDRRDEGAKGPKKTGVRVKEGNSESIEAEEKHTNSTEETERLTIENDLSENYSTDEHTSTEELRLTEKNKKYTKPKGFTNLFINLKSSEYASPMKSWYVDDGKPKKKRKIIKKQLSSFVTLYPEDITIPIHAKKRFKIEYTTMKSTESMFTLWPEEIKSYPKSNISIKKMKHNAKVTKKLHRSKTKTKHNVHDFSYEKRAINKSKKNKSKSAGLNEKMFKNNKNKPIMQIKSIDTDTEIASYYNEAGLKLILTPPKKSRYYLKTRENKREKKRKAKKNANEEYIESFKDTTTEKSYTKEETKTTTSKTVSEQPEFGKTARKRKTKVTPLAESTKDEFETSTQHETDEETLVQQSTEEGLEIKIPDKLLIEKALHESTEERIPAKSKAKQKEEKDSNEEEYIEKNGKPREAKQEEVLDTPKQPEITALSGSSKKYTEEVIDTTELPKIVSEEEKIQISTEEIDFTEKLHTQDQDVKIIKSTTSQKPTKIDTTKSTKVSEIFLSKQLYVRNNSKYLENLPSKGLKDVLKTTKTKISANDKKSDKVTSKINMRAKKYKSKKHKSKKVLKSNVSLSQSYETELFKRSYRKSNDLRLDDKDEKSVTNSVITPVDQNKITTLQSSFGIDSKNENPVRLDYWKGTTKSTLNSTISASTTAKLSTTTEQITTTTETTTTTTPKTTVVNISTVTSTINTKPEETTTSTTKSTEEFSKFTTSPYITSQKNSYFGFKTLGSEEKIPNMQYPNRPWMRQQPNMTMENFNMPEILHDLPGYQYNKIDHGLGLDDEEMKNLLEKMANTPSDLGFGNYSGVLDPDKSGMQSLTAKMLKPLTPEEKQKEAEIRAKMEKDLAQLLGDDIQEPGTVNMTKSRRRSLTFDGLNDLGPEFDMF